MIKINKKRWLIIALFFHFISISHSQDNDVYLNKREISFDEQLEVRYEISLMADSIHLNTHHGLKKVGAEATSSTYKVVNGIQSVRKSWVFLFRPTDTGTVTIKSPVFYYNGEEIIGQEVSVHIKGDLDSSDLVRLKFETFKNDYTKPDQTLRYVVTNELGYMEISENGKWVYLRRLTDNEIHAIRKIK